VDITVQAVEDLPDDLLYTKPDNKLTYFTFITSFHIVHLRGSSQLSGVSLLSACRDS
jgi:hypothetical protein